MWQTILQFLKQNRKFFLAMFFIAVAEIALSGFIESIFPETWYLRSYLSWKLMQRTRDFQDGRFQIIPDEKLGWKNQPNYTGENIHFDTFGSRSVESIAEKKRKKTRVIFLGDSRLSGGGKISNNETVSSFVEDSNLETLNFGTEYFSLDQIYLLLMDAAKQFSPDVVIVGLGSRNTELLDCLYLPFCDPDVEFALVKPRFNLEKNHLILIQPNVLEFLEDIPGSIEPLAFFHRYDMHYQKFEQFKRQEFTPFLGLFNLMKKKVGKWGDSANKMNSAHKEIRLRNGTLTNALLKAMQIYAHEWNFRLVLLLLPEKWEFENSSAKTPYDELKRLAQLNQFDFIDGRKILGAEAGTQIFSGDIHFTPEANQIIAAKLKEFCKPGS
ncbi:MAG: hypothetical protein GXO74_02710 [Calditrichaeota bacterium]|nr:hypothetical protein [Calditrichota bacterium]